MTSTSAWRDYVQAEGRYLAALDGFLAAGYGPLVRAALQGRAQDGPKGFQVAVHLLPSLPSAWLDDNIDILVELALEGGPEWFTIRPVLDRVDTARLEAQLEQLVAGLGDQATADDFQATVNLLESLAKQELLADVLDKARNSENDEIQAIAR